MTTNTTNNANPNEMNFNERRHRTRRGNENNTSTSSSAQQLQQRGAYYHHEEILSFPRGKTMSAHGIGEKIESNGNTLSGRRRRRIKRSRRRVGEPRKEDVL